MNVPRKKQLLNSKDAKFSTGLSKKRKKNLTISLINHFLSLNL